MSNSEIKAVAYARVSTLLGQNPENQLINIRQFCQGRSFNLIEEFVDTGISGAREKRPGLDALVKEARKGKFKILVITGIDRLARDTKHLLTLVQELSHYGVSLISLRENIDFSTPMGQASLTILGAVAQLERELIKERIKTALAAKKLAAEKTGSGWTCGRKPKLTKSLLIEIHCLRTSGKSLREIGEALNLSKSSVQRALREIESVPKPSLKSAPIGP